MEKQFTFRWTFPGGVGTLEVEPDHALVSPWRVAMRDGRPPGHAHWLIALDQVTGLCKLLGSFVHTAGDRLLYFPGASIEIHEKDGALPRGKLDHITLDPPTP